MGAIARLREFVDYKQISKYKFYKSVGLANGYLDRDGNIGSNKCEKIIEQYPDLNLEWLILGTGNMLTTEVLPSINNAPVGVPYYDVDFCGGFDLVLNNQTYLPAGYINLPQYEKADSWANITGHSMEPLISNGDIIALRRVEDWQTYVLYGEIYGIMTDEYRTVKRIRKAANPDHILLEPANKEYDAQEIPKSIITGVWQVLGCVKRFF